ncbi:MAG: hypothetical protein IT316_05015 [Anaerolineales bacterium]|nr:hypothetical protein [Anaerolineales bacterium]
MENEKDPSKNVPEQPQAGSLVRILLSMLEDTNDDELPCDEVHELVDHYAELDLRGEDVERIYPLIQLHLERCHDCHEEYEALLRAIRAVDGEIPAPQGKS